VIRDETYLLAIEPQPSSTDVLANLLCSFRAPTPTVIYLLPRMYRLVSCS